ncbi:MAG: DUF4012 domain-containing protein [Candidatus Moranbacteria bacterium]|nr:DUF4012 domain-containing protein [Candidatus Moranbacteria bacterium]
MSGNPKKNIIPQMFDVRPVDRSGGLDWQRINSVGGRSADIATKEVRQSAVTPVTEAESSVPDVTPFYEKEFLPSEERRDLVGEGILPDEPESRSEPEPEPKWESSSAYTPETSESESAWESRYAHASEMPEPEKGWETLRRSSSETSEPESESKWESRYTYPSETTESESLLMKDAVWEYIIGFLRNNPNALRRTSFAVAFLFFFTLGIVGGKNMLSLRGQVLGDSTEGIDQVSQALDQLIAADFDSSAKSFSDAKTSFSAASGALGPIGNALAKGSRYIPFLSKVSSGQGLIEGAGHLSSAGESLSKMIALMPGASGVVSSQDASFLTLVGDAERLTDSAQGDLEQAEEAFARVDPNDVPEEKRATFLKVREKLPVARGVLTAFREHSSLLRELLGENGSRLYLFLFQNNDELRPTGGFIGSYGLLEVNDGRIKKFFVDGIFNPDGQFDDNIVPPSPIRKISAAWSLHDSNWWPDFPTSAEKAISFYEKTGGPTVDGVVTLTPTVIRDILKITGPIDMPDYGVTVDADNFKPVIQEEVEVNYDRTRNKPKQILSDLAPILLDRLFQTKSASSLMSVVDTLSSAMSDRQILLYSRNKDVQSLISRAGWSGELLRSFGDYASVVHTNINGYKTDGVIADTVEHESDIRADGSVLDTIRITRKHDGGNTPYEWWNRVNADYMRVYVPLGSQLLSATGQTYEITKDPVDYGALGFTRDPDVDSEERGTVVRDDGTRVSEESGKTVFGNWVYVSPGESVTVEYTYLLPFIISPKNGDPASYSFLYQKQSGVESIDFSQNLSFPETYAPIWHSDGTQRNRDGFSVKGPISRDAYSGVVFLR